MIFVIMQVNLSHAWFFVLTHNVLMQAALECGSPQRAVAVFDAMLDSSKQATATRQYGLKPDPV